MAMSDLRAARGIIDRETLGFLRAGRGTTMATTAAMACPRLLAIALPLVALLHAPARADDDPPMPQPQPLPVYPAPLAQTTQSTYVPQSVAMSGPEEIHDFDFSRPVPLGYTPIERNRKHLIVGGAVTFGVVYGLSAFVASIGEDSARGERSNQVGALWVPVAGPFIQIGQTDSASGRFFLASVGAAQLAGALMLYYGVTTKERVLVRNDLVGSLGVAPLAGHGASGMALTGRF
jgi:hypothetical protein